MYFIQMLYQAFYGMLFSVVVRFVHVNREDIEFVKRLFCRKAKYVRGSVLRNMAKQHKAESLIYKYTHLRHF